MHKLWWRFVHNVIAHGWLFVAELVGYGAPRATRFHDWTAALAWPPPVGEEERRLEVWERLREAEEQAEACGFEALADAVALIATLWAAGFEDRTKKALEGAAAPLLAGFPEEPCPHGNVIAAGEDGPCGCRVSTADDGEESGEEDDLGAGLPPCPHGVERSYDDRATDGTPIAWPDCDGPRGASRSRSTARRSRSRKPCGRRSRPSSPGSRTEVRRLALVMTHDVCCWVRRTQREGRIEMDTRRAALPAHVRNAKFGPQGVLEEATLVLEPGVAHRLVLRDHETHPYVCQQFVLEADGTWSIGDYGPEFYTSEEVQALIFDRELKPRTRFLKVGERIIGRLSEEERGGRG